MICSAQVRAETYSEPNVAVSTVDWSLENQSIGVLFRKCRIPVTDLPLTKSSWKENFLNALSAQNLSHLIDPKHCVENHDVDKAQRDFLYDVFNKVLTAPEARNIVKKCKTDKHSW